MLRRVVLSRLEKQLVEQGFCPEGIKATLCLAAGKIYGDPAPLRVIFERNGWRLLETRWLVDGLERLAEESYDNSVASVVAKLLLREERERASNEEPTSREVSDREGLDEETRRRALITALYLSRFEHDRLGLGNQDQTFERAAAMLGVKKHTLRNYRDYFDAHTESRRRGWWQADLPDEVRRILQEFGSTAEDALRVRVFDKLRHEQVDGMNGRR